jgi:hypothetical protein
MPSLIPKWAGRIFGTNTGNLFLELTQDGDSVKGIVRILDNMYGLAVYEFTGTFDGKLHLNCKPIKSNNNVNIGEVTIEATLTQEGTLRGDWYSTVGTAGTFDAYPHDTQSSNQDLTNTNNIPEQIFNKNIQIGSVRLFSDDVKRIISFIAQDYRIGRAIVTYNIRGSQATKYASDFVQEIENLGEVNYLKITIQEIEAHGINKVIVLEFVEHGNSEVRVSGINEAWVLGKAVSIAQEIRPWQNVLITTYRKYGLNLNGIIFFAMLVAMPSINGWQGRAMFAVIVFVLLNLLLIIHGKFIPNTKIYLSRVKPTFLKRTWPSILSWIIAASSSLFAAWILYLLTNHNAT